MKTISFLFIFFCGSVLAQVNPKLYDMPTAENVLKNIKGVDITDTCAKQSAALYVLWDIAMSGMEKNYMGTNKPINKVITDQKQEYSEAMHLVYERYLKEKNQPETQEVRDEWHTLWANYKFHTLGFKEYLIATLFNQRAKNRYYELNGYPKPEEVDLTDANSVYQAGKNYFYGEEGVKKSEEWAFKYFKKAAEMGHPDSQYSLGYMYATGSYIKQDYAKALSWFNKAVEQNNSGAVVYIGYLYLNGHGVNIDSDKALNYFKKAISLDPNNAEIYYNIGVAYQDRKNFTEAVKYYKETLVLNPLYQDANINMSVLILKDEEDIVVEMNALGNSKEDDIKYDQLKKKREDIFKRAIPYLQRAIEINGKSKPDIINTLINIYTSLRDTENVNKMKKLLD